MKNTVKQKNGMLWSIGIVLITFVMLTAAFFILSAKYENLSQSETIGEKQLGLINVYQEAEKNLLYSDLAAKYSARQAVYDMGLHGGFYSEPACGSFYSYPLWSSENQKCFPEADLEGFFNDNFPGYASHSGKVPMQDYFVKIKTNQTGTLHTALAEKNIEADFEGQQFVTGTLSLKSHHAHYSEHTAKCWYCKDMKDDAKAWTENFACRDQCCRAPCPPGVKILETPYYNQCGFVTEKDVCASGCGAASLKMLLEYYGIQASIEQTCSLTSADCVAGKGGTLVPELLEGSKERFGTDYEVGNHKTWEYLQQQINQGRPVLVRQSQKSGGSIIPGGKSERIYAAGGHLMLVVGISDKYVVVNDPYTEDYPHSIGNYLVLSRQHFTQAWQQRNKEAGVIV